MCFKHIRQKKGGRSKIKILALSTKLNQILYTSSVDPQNATNIKTNHPKWRGVKNWKSRSFRPNSTNILYTYSVDP